MFNNKENDYLNAIKHAQVYSSSERKSTNKKLLILNFLFLTIFVYAVFTYSQSNATTFSFPKFKQAVLGVSEIIDDLPLANDRLMDILKGIDFDKLEDSKKVLMPEPLIQSKSSYTEAIGRELDENSAFKDKIIVNN